MNDTYRETMRNNGFSFGSVVLNEEGIKNLFPYMDAVIPTIMPVWVKDVKEESVVALFGSMPDIKHTKSRIVPRSYFISLVIA
jgi:hypothetical protein